ncbi:M24 family metallopeptidase [Citreicella sp. C3M06]|uniref:M24 family metallopeptidase n=1 Tax=Citreicella sp. C3M06 TaxID=2841564 RepID=UPI001C0901FC|nr:M24 family metallopeptidase [Citreicella sp. C3M06]MBU2960295.1 M24 family metallopeptidase [Citreicella sp. C3M06]
MTPRPPHDFSARRAALWQALQADAILVFGYGDALGAGSASHGAMRYLTGWNSHEAQSLAILTPEGCRLLIGSPFLAPPTGLDAAALPASGWGASIAAQLGTARKLATVGFGEMPQATFESLRAALGPATLTPADAILSRLRAIKHRSEVAAMQAGAALCDDLFDRLPQLLRRGEPVWKTQTRLETHAKLEGAEYCRTWLTVRAAADRPRYWPEENRDTPKHGDQVLFGIALTVDGYWAHGIRMGAMGQIAPDHQTLWQIAEDALIAAQTALTPGQLVQDVEAAISDVVVPRSAHWPGVQRFRGGHGLGLSYEEPLLSGAFPQHWGPEAFRDCPPLPVAVECAMMLELHPNLFVPGLGGAALGEMMLTEPGGARPLLHFPRQMFVV